MLCPNAKSFPMLTTSKSRAEARVAPPLCVIRSNPIMVSNVGQGVSRRVALLGFGVGSLGVALASGGVVASAQEGTPAPQSSHPAAGLWQWTNYPDEPNTDISYAILTGSGTYADAWYDRLVSVGEWRATGDRTADLIIVTNELISLTALFERTHVTVPSNLYEATPVTLWRIALEFDETGNHFTATGMAETQDASGAVLDSYAYTGRGDRMTLAAGPAASS